MVLEITYMMHSRDFDFFFSLWSPFLYVFCPSTGTNEHSFMQSTCRDILPFLQRTENTRSPSKRVHQLGLGDSERRVSITSVSQSTPICTVVLFH